jgi:hypothetical protein
LRLNIHREGAIAYLGRDFCGIEARGRGDSLSYRLNIHLHGVHLRIRHVEVVEA